MSSKKLQSYVVNFMNASDRETELNWLSEIYKVSYLELKKFLYSWMSRAQSEAYWAHKIQYKDFIDDAISASYELVLMNKEKYDPERGNFKSWFYKVAINFLKQGYIKFNRNQSLSSDSNMIVEHIDYFSVDYQNDYAFSDFAYKVSDYVNSNYNDVDRVFFNERFIDEKKLQEIANDYQMTPAAIHIRMRKIKGELVDNFGDEIKELNLLRKK